MVDDVVVGERLLDQEQAEIVERLERRQVVERVGRIRIDLKRDRGIAVANPAHDVDIPARRDLELDAPVAFVEVAGDQVQQGFDAALDSQADSREDLGAAASQQGMQRLATSARQEVPACHFQSGTREAISLDSTIEAGQLFDGRPFSPQHERGQKIAENVPAGLGGLGTVIRVGRTGAFAPAGHAVGDDPDQDVVEVFLAAGAGLERPDQRKANDPELDLLDPHGCSGPFTRAKRRHEHRSSRIARPLSRSPNFDISRRLCKTSSRSAVGLGGRMRRPSGNV